MSYYFFNFSFLVHVYFYYSISLFFQYYFTFIFTSFVSFYIAWNIKNIFSVQKYHNPIPKFLTMFKSPKIIGPCFHSTIFIIILIEWGWITLAKILDSHPKPMKNDRKRWIWPRNLISNFKSAFGFQHKTIIFGQKIN